MTNYRSEVIKDCSNKLSFCIKIDCAINSLKEVECFLHNLNKFSKYKHLYKFLK